MQLAEDLLAERSKGQDGHMFWRTFVPEKRGQAAAVDTDSWMQMLQVVHELPRGSPWGEAGRPGRRKSALEKWAWVACEGVWAAARTRE